MTPAAEVVHLPRRIASLPKEERLRLERIFDVTVACGQTAPPETMYGWLGHQFGSVGAVVQQRIVKVTNKVTLEGALFNELRASRPVEEPGDQQALEESIARGVHCHFCRAAEGTPADSFGRIRGRHSMTASNVAKYDGWHAVVIFDEHHPLSLAADRVADYIDTAQAWARTVHDLDPDARYPFFLWNCLWRSGASILHGHAQVNVTRGLHYARVEHWRQAALRYRAEYGTDYFADLLAVHRALDLAVDHGAAVILPSLTPFKERETVIVSPLLGADLKSAIYLVLETFVARLGVQSFNLALYQPPLSPTPECWEGFPHVVRIVDRGDSQSRTADVGAMEIFGQSVVATDPYTVQAALRGDAPSARRIGAEGG